MVIPLIIKVTNQRTERIFWVKISLTSLLCVLPLICLILSLKLLKEEKSFQYLLNKFSLKLYFSLMLNLLSWQIIIVCTSDGLQLASSLSSPQDFPTAILALVSILIPMVSQLVSRVSFTTLAAVWRSASLTSQTISSWIIITRTLSTPASASFSSDLSKAVLAMSAAEPWMRKLEMRERGVKLS